MTTTRITNRFWYIALEILAIIAMMFVGPLVVFAAIHSTPENFMGDWNDDLSNLGAVRFAIGFLLIFLIPWYRKIPLALIIIGAFYALFMQGDPYLLSIGLTVWVIRAQQRWQWVVASAGIAVVLLNMGWHLLAVLRWGDRIDTFEVLMAVFIIGFAALALTLGMSFTTRQRRRIRQADETVEAVAHDRNVISSEMTRQTEREYLAREVHDTLAQRLTALSLQTGQMQKSLADTEHGELSTALQETKQYSDQALKDLRNLVTSLREHGEKEPTVPSVVPGGFYDLKVLLDDAAHQGITVQPQIMLNSYDSAPDELQRAVLRIIQEALTNVLRHSTDNTVALVIDGQPGEGIRLEFTNLRDNRQHFDGGSGTGLLGIKERAELIGGTSQEEYLPEHFRLTVRLPWTIEAEEVH